MKRPSETVTKQVLVWVEWKPDPAHFCGGRYKPFPMPPEGRPRRIWTLFRELDPTKPPSLPITPMHHVNAFAEDYVHDWNDKGTMIDYYTRAMDCGVWLLLEYVAAV